MARSSASRSSSMARASLKFGVHFFHSRYLPTISASSLWALATLRYCSASAITAGSAIWRVSSSKRFSSWSSFWVNCMDVSQAMTSSSALGLFERHGAFQGMDGHGRLLVGGRIAW